MSLSLIFRFLQRKINIIIPFDHGIRANNYAGPMISKKKVTKEQTQNQQSKELPVETDPEKLVKYCCGLNILKDGKEVELKPDSEYPDWLWKIRIGQRPRLNELDPNTKEYWKLVRKIGIKRLVSENKYKQKYKR